MDNKTFHGRNVTLVDLQCHSALGEDFHEDSPFERPSYQDKERREAEKGVATSWAAENWIQVQKLIGDVKWIVLVVYVLNEELNGLYVE